MERDTFLMVVEGLEHLKSLDDLPKTMLQAARIAVNDTAREGRTMLANQVRREVAFPKDYVSPSSGRLSVKRLATASNLEATISARARSTSLARFSLDSATGKRSGRKPGVRVEVKPGAVKRIPGAFLIKLRAGTVSLDTKSNLGLAVRTRNGAPPPGYAPTKISDNLWLLYGPSVAQALHSDYTGRGIASDLSPDIADKLEQEFWRQMERLQ